MQDECKQSFLMARLSTIDDIATTAFDLAITLADNSKVGSSLSSNKSLVNQSPTVVDAYNPSARAASILCL